MADKTYSYHRGEKLDLDTSPDQLVLRGLIAGEVNAALTVRAAPGCRLAPVKVVRVWPWLSP
jgi:hypothetical protein